MNFTAQQYIAVYNHTQNLIVTAGAGSGKTRVLVERYLAMLESNPDWPLNALVAITFTQKAAQEMRDRVRQAFEARLSQNSEVWAQRLASIDSARIDTIHALCTTILRANAAEAGIDPDFVVLDEIDSALLFDAAVDEALQALVVERDSALELLLEYDVQKVRQALKDHRSTIFELPPAADGLWEVWQQRWQDDAWRNVRRFVEQCDAQPHFAPVGSDAMSAKWQQVTAVLDSLRECQEFELAGRYIETISHIGKPGKPAAVWGDYGDQSKQALVRIIDSAKAAWEFLETPPGSLDKQSARMLPHWASLIKRVQAEYQQAKTLQAALDFDDLEQMTCTLLRENPDVCARYQNAEFRHILVDEFQDTNESQREIVYALANPETPGCLFVVGDPKQSIYAFRNADVRVFRRVQSDIEVFGGQMVPLATSFRTHSRLVNALNNIFSHVLGATPDQPGAEYEVELGEPMDAFRAEAPAELPCIELVMCDGRKSDQHPDGLNHEAVRRWEAQEIARRIHEMVEDGVPVFDKQQRAVRPLDYQDVALLFQATTSFPLYEDVFKAEGLPFVTVSGRGYFNRQEVWDLLNLLNALYNPADQLALASVLRSPMFNFSDDALLALRLQRTADGQRPDLWQSLVNGDWEGMPQDDLLQASFARETLMDLRRSAGRVTISELLREALRATSYLAILTSLPDGARRRGNVEKLLDKSQASGKVTLRAFTQYLQEMSSREVREGEAAVDVSGAVQLMTVHASKGLEFPVVVLVDCSYAKHDTQKPLVLAHRKDGLACRVYDPVKSSYESSYAYQESEQIDQLRTAADRKRLLYVAATRAQDYLLISGGIANRSSIKHTWLATLQNALGLSEDTSLLPDQPYETSWGTLRVRFPVRPMDVDKAPATAPMTFWDSDEVREGQPFAGLTLEPPLIRPVPADSYAAFGALNGLQVGHIGASTIDSRYREQVRRSVMRDAPSTIETVGRLPSGVSGKKLGEIVHRALQWWRFPTDSDNLQAILEQYAWEQGIILPEDRARYVKDARRLLVKTKLSKIYGWVSNAPLLYRELPFIFRAENRNIHGIIDVLFQREDGTWVVLDYKTSTVKGANTQPTSAEIEAHAQRYYLQVGIYAAAVRGLLHRLVTQSARIVLLTDIVPEVYIHYIRYVHTVHVPTDVWQAAVNQLEDLIGQVME